MQIEVASKPHKLDNFFIDQFNGQDEWSKVRCWLFNTIVILFCMGNERALTEPITYPLERDCTRTLLVWHAWALFYDKELSNPCKESYRPTLTWALRGSSIFFVLRDQAQLSLVI